jgi:PEP-CTERM motif
MRHLSIAAVVIVFTAMGLAAPSGAAVIVDYNFNAPFAPASASTIAPGLTATTFNRLFVDVYGGSLYTPLYGGAPTRSDDGSSYQISYHWYPPSFYSTLPSGPDYQYFNVTVAPGYKLNVDSLSFATTTNITGGGGSMFPVVQYSNSADFSNFVTLGSFTVNGPNDTWYNEVANDAPIVDGVGTYYFRLYNTTNASGSYSWNLDNVNLNGFVVSPTPEPASLSLMGFGAATLILRRRR